MFSLYNKNKHTHTHTYTHTLKGSSETGEVRQKSSFYWSIPQMANTARAVHGKSKKPGNFSWISHMNMEAQDLDHLWLPSQVQQEEGG